MKKFTLLLMLLIGIVAYSWAQLSIDAASTDYTISFDASVTGVNEGQFDGSGIMDSPSTGQLNSNAWATTGLSDGDSGYGDDNSSGDFARGNSSGGVSSGGFYAFTVGSGNNAFGVQPTGSDWTPGTMTLRVQNNTGSTITSLELDYNIMVYNDQNRANSFNFSYSSDDAAYTSVGALDFTTPETADGSPSWQTTARNTTISSLAIADGAYFYLRWSSDDVSGGGSRDEFGIDDIVVNASAGGNAAPQIANIAYTPLYPTSSDAVTVTADVTDSDGTVSSVELKYGLTSGSYPNSVTMTNTSGDEYSGIIPTQSDGDMVYFVIEATDNSSATTTSPENSYEVRNPVTTGLPYTETFDSDLGDCYPISVSGDNKEWYWNSGGYAEMNGFGGSNLEEDWLILPGIDFSVYTDVYMNFKTKWKYGSNDANNYLKLFYSTDYSGTGDPTGSTWDELTFTLPGSADAWVSSGDIDLSGISESSVYIGFKYYSTNDPRRWSVDDINIQEATSDPEPTNYPTDFEAVADGSTSITNTWTDAVAKTQLPAAYLILINETGTFTAPVDGTPVDDDTDLNDGEGAINVDYGVESYQWTSLSPGTQYFFIIYPYTNSGTTIDYKTDGSPPTDNATTDDANLGLMISEVADPSGSGSHLMRFVELMNTGASEINFTNDTWYISKQTNGGSSWSDVKLAGTIASGAIFVIANSTSNFTTEYGFAPDQESSSVISSNGDDGYYLYYGGNHTSGTLVDAYGVIGEDGTGKDWEFEDAKGVRLRSISAPNSTWTSSEWDVPNSASRDDMTPKEHKSTATWAGTTDTVWNSKGDNWSGTYGYIPDASFNVIIPDVSNEPAISSYAACNDLTVNSDAVLTVDVAPLTVYGNLDVSASKSRAGGSFIVGSTDTQNGSVILYGTQSGSVSVERYIEGWDDGADNGWHNISSPVNNMVIAGSDFAPGDNDDLYQWDEPSNTWENYKQGHFANFENGKGYLNAFELSGTKKFVGTLNNSDITKTNMSADDGKFHLMGNPFASAVVWNNGDWSLTDVGGVAKIWDESNNNYADIAADDIIPSTNGFFVEVASATNSITIPASARAHDISNNYKKSALEEMDETLKFTITNDENTYYDICKVGFKAEATEEWDMSFDSHKLFGGSANSQLWSVSNNEIFSINYLPYVYESYQLALHFKAGVNGIHHIHVEGLESFYINSEIYLEDVLLDKTINLTEQQFYSFNASTEDAESRFILYFYGVTSTGSDLNENETIIYSNENTVFVKANKLPANGFEVDVFNALGQQVYSTSLEPETISSFKLIEKPGMYIIRLRSENGVQSQKVMIR